MRLFEILIQSSDLTDFLGVTTTIARESFCPAIHESGAQATPECCLSLPLRSCERSPVQWPAVILSEHGQIWRQAGQTSRPANEQANTNCKNHGLTYSSAHQVRCLLRSRSWRK